MICIKKIITKPIYDKCIPQTPFSILKNMIDNNSVISKGKKLYYIRFDLDVYGIKDGIITLSSTMLSLNLGNHRVFDQFQFLIE